MNDSFKPFFQRKSTLIGLSLIVLAIVCINGCISFFQYMTKTEDNLIVVHNKWKEINVNVYKEYDEEKVHTMILEWEDDWEEHFSYPVFSENKEHTTDLTDDLKVQHIFKWVEQEKKQIKTFKFYNKIEDYSVDYPLWRGEDTTSSISTNYYLKVFDETRDKEMTWDMNRKSYSKYKKQKQYWIKFQPNLNNYKW